MYEVRDHNGDVLESTDLRWAAHATARWHGFIVWDTETDEIDADFRGGEDE